jgi:hypothetical protein
LLYVAFPSRVCLSMVLATTEQSSLCGPSSYWTGLLKLQPPLRSNSFFLCLSSSLCGSGFLLWLLLQLPHSSSHFFIFSPSEPPPRDKSDYICLFFGYQNPGSKILGLTFHTLWAIILVVPSTFLRRTWGPQVPRTTVSWVI